MVPVTIKQLLSASKSSGDSDESYQIDGREVSHVRLIGNIMSSDHKDTKTTYTIEDSSGKIEVSSCGLRRQSERERKNSCRGATQRETRRRLAATQRRWNNADEENDIMKDRRARAASPVSRRETYAQSTRDSRGGAGSKG